MMVVGVEGVRMWWWWILVVVVVVVVGVVVVEVLVERGAGDPTCSARREMASGST